MRRLLAALACAPAALGMACGGGNGATDAGAGGDAGHGTDAAPAGASLGDMQLTY